MQKFGFSLAIAIATTFAFQCSNTNADVIIEFSDGMRTDVAFNVGIGSTKTIFVFATESSPHDDLSVDGLVGFGLHADYMPAIGFGALVTANQVNPDFDTDDDGFSSSALELAGSTFDDPVAGSSVLLGQFDVSVTDYGTTVFTFDDYTPGIFADFVSAAIVNLDPTIFGGGGGRQFELTIVGVPEPAAGFVLVGLVLYGASRRRR